VVSSSHLSCHHRPKQTLKSEMAVLAFSARRFVVQGRRTNRIWNSWSLCHPLSVVMAWHMALVSSLCRDAHGADEWNKTSERLDQAVELSWDCRDDVESAIACGLYY